MTERQELGSLEAMLFAHAEPVETARLADALRLDADEVTTLLQKLQKHYDEQESGMVILYFEPDRWQMTTRPYYGEMVKRILDTRRNAPLSPAASKRSVWRDRKAGIWMISTTAPAARA